MGLTAKAKRALTANIAALEELPIERIPAVIGGQKPEEVSILYRKCQQVEITPKGLTAAKQIVKKMSRILKRYREITQTGRALAANQIGVDKKIAIFLLPDDSISVYLNPEITWRSKQKNVYWEICLSGAPLGADVVRPASVRVGWYDLEGKQHQEKLAGFDARRIQHEIEHLEGKTCYHARGTIYRTLGYGLDPSLYMNQKLRPV